MHSENWYSGPDALIWLPRSPQLWVRIAALPCFLGASCGWRGLETREGGRKTNVPLPFLEYLLDARYCEAALLVVITREDGSVALIYGWRTITVFGIIFPRVCVQAQGRLISDFMVIWGSLPGHFVKFEVQYGLKIWYLFPLAQNFIGQVRTSSQHLASVILWFLSGIQSLPEPASSSPLPLG